jgi:hypothetical protein
MRRNSTPKVNSLRANRGGTRKSSQNGRNGNADPALRIRPSYPGQPTLEIWIPGTPEVLSTTVTTGVIAETTTLSNALIPSFSAKWGTTWTDHRITKFRVKLTNFSSTNPGLLSHWFDEEVSTAPTAALAISAKAKRFGASLIGTKTIEFVVRDPSQLNYSLLTVVTNYGYYKLFTNNADFGSSIVATQYCLKEVEALVQFRGFL